MLPRVIIHNAVSVDGRVDWFTADIARFYELTSTWAEDATLAGSETLLQAYKGVDTSDDVEEAFQPAEIDKDDSRPILVVPDSKGKLKIYNLLRKEEYWKGIVVLCSESTPKSFIQYLEKNHFDFIVAGAKNIDFRIALEGINNRYGVNTVRVDSGGTLNGVLLRAGLVDEVSILIHPFLVGGTSPASMFRAPDLTSADGVIPLKLLKLQKEGDLFWLRYEIVKPENPEPPETTESKG